MRRLLISLLAVMLLSSAACTQTGGTHARAVYVLLDVSQSYNPQLAEANPVINYLLASLVSGDSLTVASIDSASFTEKDVIAKVTFDDRPSIADEQKRAFRARLNQFFAHRQPSNNTDVSGAMLQAAQDLDETGAGHRYILVFSDLQQDLPKGYVRKARLPLRGMRVIAVDVSKLHTDNVNPQNYLNRLAHWKHVVTADGGHWEVINDLSHLDRVFGD